MHVVQATLHVSHVAVEMFPKVPAGQTDTHIVPDKNLPIAQAVQFVER